MLMQLKKQKTIRLSVTWLLYLNSQMAKLVDSAARHLTNQNYSKLTEPVCVIVFAPTNLLMKSAYNQLSKKYTLGLPQSKTQNLFFVLLMGLFLQFYFHLFPLIEWLCSLNGICKISPTVPILPINLTEILCI